MSQEKEDQNISSPQKAPAPRAHFINVPHPQAICFPGEAFLAQLLCQGWFLRLHPGKYPIQVSTGEKYFIEELVLNPP